MPDEAVRQAAVMRTLVEVWMLDGLSRDASRAVMGFGLPALRRRTGARSPSASSLLSHGRRSGLLVTDGMSSPTGRLGTWTDSCPHLAWKQIVEVGEVIPERLMTGAEKRGQTLIHTLAVIVRIIRRS